MECNMDPDEAVSRLLAQDSFKPVKNKRHRRKEMKETQESRARCNSGTDIPGVRFGREHAAGRTGSSENNYNELGKTAYKREMISADPSISSSSSYTYRATGKFINEQPSAYSKFLNAYNRRRHSIGTGDTIFPSVHMPQGLQPTWLGTSQGHVSMAEIVRRGGPQIKGSQMSSEISCSSQPVALQNTSNYHLKSAQVFSSPESELHQELYSSNPSSFSEMTHEPAMTGGQRDFDNEWPVIEHLPPATGSLIIDASATTDDVQIPERSFDSQNQSSDNGSASPSSRHIFANSAGIASNNGFTPRQQNNLSSIWDLGVETQTMPMPFDSSYYSLPRQNQHHAGYQHDQQASQDYESLWYPNTYHSERSTRTSTRRRW